MKGLRIDDEHQDQADRKSQREPHRDAERGQHRAFSREDHQHLCTGHADVAQHAEFTRARERLR